jgi:thiamine biosynthesis lipoprotein ApbE
VLKPLLGFLAMLGAAFLVLFWQPTYEALHVGNTMGTTYRVKWLSNQGTEETQEIRVGIDKQLEDVNRRMSTYLPDSELRGSTGLLAMVGLPSQRRRQTW